MLLQNSKNESFDVEELLQALPKKDHERLWSGLRDMTHRLLLTNPVASQQNVNSEDEELSVSEIECLAKNRIWIVRRDVDRVKYVTPLFCMNFTAHEGWEMGKWICFEDIFLSSTILSIAKKFPPVLNLSYLPSKLVCTNVHLQCPHRSSNNDKKM